MMNFWWICALITFIVILYKYFSRNVNFWKDRGVNGPKPLPFFGNLFDNFKTPINELELERFRKYGKVYGYLDLQQPILSISDIELLKYITMKDFHCFMNHANMAPGDPLLSKLMVNLVDDDWKRVRNICMPAFSSSKIKQMFPLINDVVSNGIEYFDELAAKKQPIELQKTFSSIATDVVARVIFGVHVNSLKDPDGEYSYNAATLFPISSPRVIIGVIMPTVLRRILGYYSFNPSSCQYFKRIIKHIINERKGKAIQKNLLKLLMDSEINDAKLLSEINDEGFGSTYLEVKSNKVKLDESEILAQSVLMVIAGTETVSTTMMYFLFTMATKPEIQEKLYKELKQFFDTQEYNIDSIMSLPYLDAVIHETLRSYTPVIQLDRVASCDYDLPGIGITIPKGTIINLPFHVIHHDPDYWEDPFEFKPERFLPENRDRLVPNTFVPFGMGPRICLGMKLGMAELKITIANIIYRYEVLKTDKTPDTPKYNGKKFTNHCEPIYVLFKRRIT